VPFVETHELVTVPCASVLAAARAREGIGDRPARVVAMTGSAGDLPGARDEAVDLRRHFRDVEVVAGIGDAAAFTAVAGRADVLHIAAHARVNDNSPWDSGFWLGGASPPATVAAGPDTSGLLTPADSAEVARAFAARPTLAAWQIAAASLPNQVAVLAGCETGGGRVTRGEGVLGLTAAFLSAGVPVVVSAAWPVDDRVTARFMRYFYRGLSAGHPVGEALRRAQADLQEEREYSHPFFWAGFTVAGDGARVVTVRRVGQTRWPLVFGGIGVVAGVLLVWWRARRRENRV
jgi:CHAT domain-containing protein